MIILKHHAVFLGFAALLAATLLSPVASAPVQKSNQTDHWWYHPCSGAPGKLRHSRSADHLLNQVYYQLKTFIGRLAQNIEQVQNIYKPMRPTPPTLKTPWLRIERMLKVLKSPKRSKKIAAGEEPPTLIMRRLQQFHEHLQFFAGALEMIGNVDVETEVSNFSDAKRKAVYKNNTDQLKLLLCEVFTTLENYNVKVPDPLPLGKMKLPKLKKLDLTRAYNLDLTFHTKMKKFFNRTQRILKGRKHKSGHKSSAVHKSKRT